MTGDPASACVSDLLQAYFLTKETIPHSWENRNSLAYTVEAGVHTCLKGSPGARLSGFPPTTPALLPGFTNRILPEATKISRLDQEAENPHFKDSECFSKKRAW